MKEQIILAPGASGTEILRSLAKNGVNSIGLKIVSSNELAKIALMKSGVSVTEEFLTKKEEASVIFSFLNGIPYFANASYADAENLASALCIIRGLAKDTEETIKVALEKGPFKDKNEAIFEVYKHYMQTLTKEGKLDSIGLAKKAISESKPFDGEFLILKEYPITPLEEELISHVSNGNYSASSLSELFNKEEKKVSVSSYTEGYGNINEAESIIAKLFKNKTSLDQCTIACASSAEYAQVFYDISRQHDLPITFGSGIPINNTNPARLLALILDWCTAGYFGIDALKRILFCEGLNRKKLAELFGLEDGLTRDDIEGLSEMGGNLRISFDAAENSKRLLAYKPKLEAQLALAYKTGREKDIKSAERKNETMRRLELLAKEFELGCARFIDKYVIIRPEPVGRIDQAALNVITESLNAYEKYVKDGKLEDIIEEILNKTVCSESSKEGCLHVTSIQGALSSVRPHMFICGLSASSFPGKPMENYLLLDEDLTGFISEDKAPTSKNKIQQRKESLNNLLALASALGSDISISFSGYDLSELKDQNPSSVLFSLYEKENPGKSIKDFAESVEKAEYFKSEIGLSRLVGAEYALGSDISSLEEYEAKEDSKAALEKAWSPSALEVFFQCPRHFYLANILHIPEEEEDNPFEVISAADIGKLAHSMMEELANVSMDEKTFLAKSEEIFDAFLISRPPMHKSSADKEKAEFLKMMQSAYKLDPHNEVLSAEDEYVFEHPIGIKLHGYPDRVEKDAKGEYIIADFKTKRKIEHVKDDIDTCLQVVIYAWLCEKADIPISRCEYRYLRKNKSVSCEYNDVMKDKLATKLEIFKNALETNVFERVETKESCKYCKMAGICKFKEDETAKEGEDE